MEILTNRNSSPSRDWLSYAVSPRTKAKIRQWFAQEEKAKAVDFGHDLLEKEMRKAGLAKSRLANPETLKSLGFNTLDDLNAAVAFGRFSIGKILQMLAPEKFRTPPPPAKETPREQPAEADLSKNVLVSGQGDIFVRLARCCSPLLGAPIIGYITQGHGVSIHSAACGQLAGLDPDRFVNVSWSDREESLFDVYLRLRLISRPGVFAEITGLISQKAENVLEAHLSDDRTESDMWFRLAVRNQAQFEDLLQTLKRHSAVKRAERFFPA